MMTQISQCKDHGKEYKEFGKRLADTRDNRGFTQDQFSKILNIPQSTYAAYEKGTRKISISLLKKISVSLNVTSDYLLEMFNPKRQHNSLKVKDSNTVEYSISSDVYSDTETIAAHHDGDELSEEEWEYIELTIETLKKRRKRRLDEFKG